MNELHIEKIKSLREKISVSLKTASDLLTKNNGDILLCEKEFHDNNINEICKIAQCDESIAKEYYLLFKFDVCKSIEKINQRQVIITTGKDTNHKNKIGFILWPENSKGEFYKTDKRNDVFISTYDFNYIMDEFKSVFPLRNPWNNIIEESFDACGHNFFDNKTCRQIIERISNINHNDEKVQQFLKEVIAWFNDKLEYADYITVYGNL